MDWCHDEPHVRHTPDTGWAHPLAVHSGTLHTVMLIEERHPHTWAHDVEAFEEAVDVKRVGAVNGRQASYSSRQQSIKNGEKRENEINIQACERVSRQIVQISLA